MALAHATLIASAKCSVWVKLKLFYGKNSSKKTPDTRKITPFLKSPKLATMQSLQILQTRHFGSKIKILKNITQRSLEAH